MKTLLGIILLTIVVNPVYVCAQNNEETLFNGHIEHGGFGGPVFKLSSVNNETALFAGGRGGWILKFSPTRSFVIGGGGYGLVNDIKAPGIFKNDRQLYLSIAYGGLELEYIYHPNKLIHFSAQTLIGGGGVGYRYKDNEDSFNTDSFFIFEPGINAIMNISHFFRIGGGISYRFVNGSHLPDGTNADLKGLSGVFTFKFGKF